MSASNVGKWLGAVYLIGAIERPLCEPKSDVRVRKLERPRWVGFSLSTGAISTSANFRIWLISDEIGHLPERRLYPESGNRAVESWRGRQ